VRAILIWASIAIVAGTICLVTVLGFDALQPIRYQRVSFLVASIDPNGTFAFALGLFSIALCGMLITAWWRARKRASRILLGLVAMLVPLVALPACALAGFLAFFAGSYTEIPASAAGRELVVREYGVLFAGGAHVYERDGVVLRWIARLPPAGDTYQPFGRGDFDVIRSGDHVVLRWQTEDPPGSDWVRLP
jgi:hypothetical protein